MIDRDYFFAGLFLGALIAGIFLIMEIFYDAPARYCPAILEHAPDTLVVVQEFPACLKHTEMRP